MKRVDDTPLNAKGRYDGELWIRMQLEGGAEGYAAAPSFMNSDVRSGLRAGRGVLEALQTGDGTLQAIRFQ